MTFDPVVRLAVIGCGAQAASIVAYILSHFSNTSIVVVCEPSDRSYQIIAGVFRAAGLKPPPNEPDLDQLLESWAGLVDVAYIASPHWLHFNQARACLEAGLDVLDEKPMVKTSDQARELIRVRDLTGGFLAVAFQGSFSPSVRRGAEIIRSGELGPVQGIAGWVWQKWIGPNTGEWRTDLDASGGGFFFDTGAHLLNIICDLASDDLSMVSATLDHDGGPVDVNASVMGRLRSGPPVSLFGCGNTAESCGSEVRIFCSDAILRTTIWGGSLEVMRQQPEGWSLPGSSRDQGWENVPVETDFGIWETFLRARERLIPNPSPPELGLRMALLWDAIRESAHRQGVPISLDT